MPHAFVADVHLGKLSRMLRLLGIDVQYRNDYTKPDLLEIASREHRVVLSRDVSFAKHPSIAFYHTNNEEPLDQL